MNASEDRFGLFAVADATSYGLTYVVPSGLNLKFGQAALVPVGKRKCVGIFLEFCEKPSFLCKQVEGILPYSIPFSPQAIALAKWVAQYYLASLGRTIRLFAPGFFWDFKKNEARLKRFQDYFSLNEAGDWIATHALPVKLKGEFAVEPSEGVVELSEEQSQCLELIFTSEQAVTLLHGITGAGKTEVYLQAAERVLKQGQRVLVLVPEIALTPQMSARFRKVFCEKLAILHSGLTPVEYEREWFRVHRNQAEVVLGVRSAVFAPVQNLGLIIVDEEHDSSYKCDEFPCYQARDVAVKRAILEKCRCILGSATPSMESFSNASTAKYAYATLKKRQVGSIPTVEVVDAKSYLPAARQKAKDGQNKAMKTSLLKFDGCLLARPVIEALEKTRQRQEQAMVILNRRGYANYCLCAQCGNALMCPNCSVTTTLHKRGEMELCHYCGFTRKTLTTCPQCSCTTLVQMGAGTQNVEDELALELPQLKVARLDRDMFTSQSRVTGILESFRSGETDCLVGTQLLSKGHDFPKVSLVVVLHVEDGLFLPDFRAGERTFQLLTQAAGRAGRGEGREGRVLLQSLAPGHSVVTLAIQGEIEKFLRNELDLRALGWHPPFSRQILFEFHGKSPEEAMSFGNGVREELVEHWKNIGISPHEVRISGPYPATLEKLKGVYRYHMCVASEKRLLPMQLIPSSLLDNPRLFQKMRVDVDPYSFL